MAPKLNLSQTHYVKLEHSTTSIKLYDCIVHIMRSILVYGLMGLISYRWRLMEAERCAIGR